MVHYCLSPSCMSFIAALWPSTVGMFVPATAFVVPITRFMPAETACWVPAESVPKYRLYKLL